MIRKVYRIFRYGLHYITYKFQPKEIKCCIDADIKRLDTESFFVAMSGWKPFKNIFYMRIPRNAWSIFLQCISPPEHQIEILLYRGGIIKEGLKIQHTQGCTIHPHYLGKNATIFQGVTIGDGKQTKIGKCPVIGDDVIIYANAVVVGGITIGDNVTIGAGSLVISDVPANAVVGGGTGKSFICEK